jgi:hypothetical protein
MSTYEFHPIADAWPMLKDDEFEKLVEDIRANGLKQDIVIYEGKILDGRNRYLACQGASAQIYTVQYAGTDPVGHARSLNDLRRHLSDSERAMVAAKLANLSNGQKSSSANLLSTPITQSAAAEMMNVSPRLVTGAKRGLKESPELAEKVATGQMTVHAAETQIRKKEEDITGKPPEASEAKKPSVATVAPEPEFTDEEWAQMVANSAAMQTAGKIIELLSGIDPEDLFFTDALNEVGEKIKSLHKAKEALLLEHYKNSEQKAVA